MARVMVHDGYGGRVWGSATKRRSRRVGAYDFGVYLVGRVVRDDRPRGGGPPGVGRRGEGGGEWTGEVREEVVVGLLPDSQGGVLGANVGHDYYDCRPEGGYEGGTVGVVRPSWLRLLTAGDPVGVPGARGTWCSGRDSNVEVARGVGGL